MGNIENTVEYQNNTHTYFNGLSTYLTFESSKCFWVVFCSNSTKWNAHNTSRIICKQDTENLTVISE